MADERKQVEAIMGPYRGKRLTMTTADADAAVNAHWAIDPYAERHADDEPHDPLTDEQRAAALDAANAWAQAQQDAAAGTTAPPDPIPESGARRSRTLRPDETSGDYKTRGS